VETGEFPDAAAIVDKAQEQLAGISETEYRRAVATRPELETLLADSDHYDPLTGVLAPAAGEAHAESEFKAARAAGQSLSLIKVNLDNLPTIVRSLGLEAADAVLFETGAILQQQFAPKGGQVSRAQECVFDVVVRGLDRVGAVKAAGELREMIRRSSARWKLPGIQSLPVSTSVGVATMEPGAARQFAGLQQLIKAGERALAAATKGGGNCVRAFVPKAA
jgi:diguanylate cyclase (GGDEF)-like protein